MFVWGFLCVIFEKFGLLILIYLKIYFGKKLNFLFFKENFFVNVSVIIIKDFLNKILWILLLLME